jgi:dTDP-4-dehydrorhamnose 3,5-epimerase
MLIRETPIKGAHLIELERRQDERGFFARLFCDREFEKHGLESRFVQVNNSFSARRGTLRGLHYQLPPAAEAKIVRCTRGALYDAILDIRRDSPSFGKSFGAELTAENCFMMYVPRGCAHAILSLTDDTETLYLTSNYYAPDRERGIRWNDPRFAIQWPIYPTEISDKDAAWPDFDPAEHGVEQLIGLI